jgi:beta-glucanase (GH16 family)
MARLPETLAAAATAAAKAAPDGAREAAYLQYVQGAIGANFLRELWRGDVKVWSATVPGTMQIVGSKLVVPTQADQQTLATADIDTGEWLHYVRSATDSTQAISSVVTPPFGAGPARLSDDLVAGQPIGLGDFFLFAPPLDSVTPPGSQPVPVGQPTGKWALSFEDHFNASSLNTAVWNTVQFYGEIEVLPDGSKVSFNGTSATNYDTNANGNSCLRIWPQLTNGSKWVERTIDTDGKFSQKYGYFEARMKMPVGRGLWPAFWLYNHIGNLRPEIDVVEAYNGAGSSVGWGTNDVPVLPNNYSMGGTLLDNGAALQTAGPWKLQSTVFGFKLLSDDFHVYATEWTETEVAFFFDGVEIARTSTFNVPYSMYLLLDLWYGGAAGVPSPDASITPRGSSNSVLVDYVRAWTRA